VTIRNYLFKKNYISLNLINFEFEYLKDEPKQVSDHFYTYALNCPDGVKTVIGLDVLGYSLKHMFSEFSAFEGFRDPKRFMNMYTETDLVRAIYSQFLYARPEHFAGGSYWDFNFAENRVAVLASNGLFNFITQNVRKQGGPLQSIVNNTLSKASIKFYKGSLTDEELANAISRITTWATEQSGGRLTNVNSWLHQQGGPSIQFVLTPQQYTINGNGHFAYRESTSKFSFFY
jgi:hypothetical protein